MCKVSGLSALSSQFVFQNRSIRVQRYLSGTSAKFKSFPKPYGFFRKFDHCFSTGRSLLHLLVLMTVLGTEKYFNRTKFVYISLFPDNKQTFPVFELKVLRLLVGKKANRFVKSTLPNSRETVGVFWF